MEVVHFAGVLAAGELVPAASEEAETTGITGTEELELPGGTELDETGITSGIEELADVDAGESDS